MRVWEITGTFEIEFELAGAEVLVFKVELCRRVDTGEMKVHVFRSDMYRVQPLEAGHEPVAEAWYVLDTTFDDLQLRAQSTKDALDEIIAAMRTQLTLPNN